MAAVDVNIKDYACNTCGKYQPIGVDRGVCRALAPTVAPQVAIVLDDPTTYWCGQWTPAVPPIPTNRP